jgi:hypothetical protein
MEMNEDISLKWIANVSVNLLYTWDSNFDIMIKHCEHILESQTSMWAHTLGANQAEWDICR